VQEETLELQAGSDCELARAQVVRSRGEASLVPQAGKIVSPTFSASVHYRKSPS
jgi:hypothetical protein